MSQADLKKFFKYLRGNKSARQKLANATAAQIALAAREKGYKVTEAEVAKAVEKHRKAAQESYLSTMAKGQPWGSM